MRAPAWLRNWGLGAPIRPSAFHSRICARGISKNEMLSAVIPHLITTAKQIAEITPAIKWFRIGKVIYRGTKIKGFKKK